MSEAAQDIAEPQEPYSIQDLGSRTRIVVPIRKDYANYQGCSVILTLLTSTIAASVYLMIASEGKAGELSGMQLLAVIANGLVLFFGGLQILDAKYGKTVIEFDCAEMRAGSRLFGIGWSRSYAIPDISRLRFARDVKKEYKDSLSRPLGRYGEGVKDTMAEAKGDSRLELKFEADGRPVLHRPASSWWKRRGEDDVPYYRRAIVFDYNGKLKAIAVGIGAPVGVRLVSEIERRFPELTEARAAQEAQTIG